MSFRFSTLVLALSAALASLSGCIGASEPDDLQVERAPLVGASTWRGAPAGCEGLGVGLVLHRCEGEALLGALIEPDTGRARCVDALELLSVELRARERLDVRAGDPSPQPSHPGDPRLR